MRDGGGGGGGGGEKREGGEVRAAMFVYTTFYCLFGIYV